MHERKEKKIEKIEDGRKKSGREISEVKILRE